MNNEKSIQYKKAYVELNEILKVLSKEQRDKIPISFINNVLKDMDKDYKFKFDYTKEISEQKVMVETEALLVEIYERYIASDEEKEKWKEYDRICLNRIEEEKKNKYKANISENNKDNGEINITNDKIDDKEISNKNIFPIKQKKERLFGKIINNIKKFLVKHIENKK